MSTTLSRRRLLQLAGAGTLGMGMASCAPSASNDTSGDTGAATDDGVQQDFTFAAWSVTEDAPKPVIEGMIDTFATQAEVDIEAVAWPYNEY